MNLNHKIYGLVLFGNPTIKLPMFGFVSYLAYPYTSRYMAEWTDYQRQQYNDTKETETFKCKNWKVSYGWVSSLKCWKYTLYSDRNEKISSGITYQDKKPLDFFRMLIYSKLGIDFYRRSPYLPSNQLINKKGDIKTAPPHTLYIFDN